MEISTPVLKSVNGGLIDLKSVGNSDDMRFSGYASTNTSDLVDDIVEPMSFQKYLYRYKNNPVICYNHDRDFPIGRALSVEITDRGLWMDMELLKDAPAMPLIRGYIWPCIKEGVLSQMSIGFMSLDGKWEGAHYHHKEVYLLENSVVTVACNPDAMIGVSKALRQGLVGLNSMTDMVEAYQKGVLRLPEDISKNFYVGGIEVDLATSNKDMKDNMHPLTPDFTDMVATEETTIIAPYDPEGVPIRKPYPSQKNYTQVHEWICAAKRVSGDKTTYLFEIGYPTKKGFAYDWDKIALTMCRVLGAKGGAHFNAEEKAKVVDRLIQAYSTLDKEPPEVCVGDGDDTLSIVQLTPEALSTIKYQDVKFNAGEAELLTKSLLENDLKSIQDIAKSYEVKADIPEELRTIVAKGIYATIDIWGLINTPEDAAMVAALLNIVTAPCDCDDDTPSAYDEMGAPIAEAKAEVDNDRVEMLRLLASLLEENS